MPDDDIVFEAICERKTMYLNDLLKEKREDILRLAEEHGAYNVRIFGSVARTY